LPALTRARFLAGSVASAAAARAAPAASSASRPFYVLVLSGGGAYGAYEAGVISGLEALGIDYDVVCGTSIGALNGAMYASDQVPRLVELWRHISQRPVVALPEDLQPRASTAVLSRLWLPVHRVIQAVRGKVTGIYAAQPVRDILHEMLVTPDGRQVVPFRRTFFWAVTNLSDLCGGYYYQGAARAGIDPQTVQAAFRRKGAKLRTIAPDQPNAFVEALRASSAIPAFFEPAGIGADLFVDGGVINNTPYDVAKTARQLLAPGRPLEIHAVFNAPLERTLKPVDLSNALKILFACYDLMQKRLVEDAARLTLREADLAGRLLPDDPELAADESLRNALGVTIRYVRPASTLDGELTGFDDQKAIDKNFDRGMSDIGAGWRVYRDPGEFCGPGVS